MKYIAALLLACAFVAFHPPLAVAMTGAELSDSCQGTGASADASRCSVYIQGFVDGMIMGYTAHGTSRGYCPPVTGVTEMQGRAIVERFLRLHPERLKTQAGILAGFALSEAYPCKKAK